MIDEKRTQFDYLLNALLHASQSDKPAEHGYAEKRRALFAYVRGLEARQSADGVPASDEPSMNERIAAALECLEDNDNHGATVILKAALGVEVPVNCREAGPGRGLCIECANGHYERCLYTRPRGVAMPWKPPPYPATPTEREALAARQAALGVNAPGEGQR